MAGAFVVDLGFEGVWSGKKKTKQREMNSWISSFCQSGPFHIWRFFRTEERLNDLMKYWTEIKRINFLLSSFSVLYTSVDVYWNFRDRKTITEQEGEEGEREEARRRRMFRRQVTALKKARKNKKKREKKRVPKMNKKRIVEGCQWMRGKIVYTLVIIIIVKKKKRSRRLHTRTKTQINETKLNIHLRDGLKLHTCRHSQPVTRTINLARSTRKSNPRFPSILILHFSYFYSLN